MAAAGHSSGAASPPDRSVLESAGRVGSTWPEPPSKGRSLASQPVTPASPSPGALSGAGASAPSEHGSLVFRTCPWTPSHFGISYLLADPSV